MVDEKKASGFGVAMKGMEFAGTAVAVVDLAQRFTPVFDFFPHWLSLLVSVLATLVVAWGTILISRWMWRSGRRRIAFVLPVLLFAFAGVYGAWKFGLPVRVKANTIAVFPFATIEPAQIAGGRHVAALITSALDGAGELRTVESPTVFAQYSGAPSEGSLDSIWGMRIARRMRAGKFVLGTVISGGGRVAVHARLYDTRTATRISEASRDGSPGELDELASRVAVELGSRMRYGDGRPQLMLGVGTAFNHFGDLNLYYQAEDAFRAGAFDSTSHVLRSRIENGSPFAPSYYVLSLADLWNGDFDRSLQAIRSARAGMQHLAPRDTLLISGIHSELIGDTKHAFEAFGQVLLENNRDIEAHYEMGALLYDSNPFQGKSRSEAEDHFVRVLASDPEHFPSLYYMTLLSMEGTNNQATLNFVRRALRCRPDTVRNLGFSTLQAHLLGNQMRYRELLRVVGGQPEAAFSTIDLLSEAWRANPEDTAALLGIEYLLGRLRANSAKEVKQRAAVLTAELAAARGRWSDAAAAIASPEVGSHQQASFAGQLAVHPFRRMSEAGLENAVRKVRSWPIDPATPVTRYTVIRPAIRDYLLGLLFVRLGQGDSARAALHRLDNFHLNAASSEAPAYVLPLVHDLASAVSAEMARARGDDANARGRLETLGVLPPRSLLQHPIYAHSRERYVRAELLRESGDYLEAIQWYSSLLQDPAGLPYLAPAHLGLARTYERLRKWPEAADHYERFATFYNAADSESTEEVRHAVERSRALRREGTDRTAAASGGAQAPPG